LRSYNSLKELKTHNHLPHKRYDIKIKRNMGENFSTQHKI